MRLVAPHRAVVTIFDEDRAITANQELLVSEAGVLGDKAFDRVLDAVISILRPGKQTSGIVG